MNRASGAGPHIIQIVGYKNTGKTTMTAALIAGLSAKGLKVAAIKHDGHDHFEMDQEGTDTSQFGKAGAAAVVIMSETRTAMIEKRQTRLSDMLNHLSGYDWIVVEGFKHAPYPKFVMVREASDLMLITHLQGIEGIISWLPQNELELPDGVQNKDVAELKWFPFHEPERVIEALLQRSKL